MYLNHLLSFIIEATEMAFQKSCRKWVVTLKKEEGSSLAIGLSLGLLYGLLFDNLALGLGLGVAFGASGVFVSKKRKK